jgi:hypothetical protein
MHKKHHKKALLGTKTLLILAFVGKKTRKIGAGLFKSY